MEEMNQQTNQQLNQTNTQPQNVEPQASQANQPDSRQPYNESGSGQVPGHGEAVASLIVGIIGTVLCFFGVTAGASIVFGIIGLVLASASKKAGNDEGTRTAGFAFSLISLILGIVIVLIVIFVLIAASGYTSYLDPDVFNSINY